MVAEAVQYGEKTTLALLCEESKLDGSGRRYAAMMLRRSFAQGSTGAPVEAMACETGAGAFQII